MCPKSIEVPLCYLGVVLCVPLFVSLPNNLYLLQLNNVYLNMCSVGLHTILICVDSPISFLGCLVCVNNLKRFSLIP